MAKNKKRTASKNNAVRNTGVNAPTGPYFVIANVEGDIRRKGKSTTELCEKYGRSPEEIHALISRAYHGSEGKVRELTRILDSNNDSYNKRMAAKNRQNGASADTANIAVEVVKTPKELQQEVVAQAQSNLAAKTQDVSVAETALIEARARKSKAQENLAKAKKEMTDAEDAEMKAISKLHSAQSELSISRTAYEAEVAKLKEMDTPVLMHISALKDGIPGGKVYMSAYDYDKLSAADQAKVIPITPEDISFSYPDDFYQYPEKLGVDGYKSACQFAMAYVELVLDNQDDVVIELLCKDELVKTLAEAQEA